MRRFLAVVTALFLAGCVTDDRQARLKPHIGRTMADFSRDTGMTPSDSYNTASGRVFVVNGPAMTVAVAPGVAVAGGCKMLIETTAIGTQSTADNWRIASIDAHGPC